MNNFKELAKLVKKRKEKINALYESSLKTQNLSGELLEALHLCELKPSKTLILAILRRFVDMKEENLVEEFKKNHFSKEKIISLKHQIYDLVCKFYTKEHEALIAQIQDEKLVDDFYLALIQGVHEIGLVMNDFQKVWTKQIIETNNEILATQFQSLDEALAFLKKQNLYQKDRNNEPCERCYAALVRIGQMWKISPYAQIFENEILRLEYAFDVMIQRLQNLAKQEDEYAYITYLEKLKLAFCQKDNDEVIRSWQEAELAWMSVRSPLQIGHPLEYYEDNYTHAVALEWDIRLADESDFDAKEFNTQIKESFNKLYNNTNLQDENLQTEVMSNLEKTQLYICMPMIYYGAEMNGLFSAQVVPNDEFVSSKAGKKIFAFLNFVYENAKTKPFMKISSQVFDKEFLDYGREILFYKEEIWKKVYEVSTIGHEFGHIFFIAKDSEKKMNESGVFKNIEEFKATSGGLMNFFFHEKEELKMPVFHELIKRAVGLIAWQRVEEVKPYYTEGLIHLSILFRSGVLEFEGNQLKVDFSLRSYENFKEEMIRVYIKLAKCYMKRLDAWEFLKHFCKFEDQIFLPLDEKCEKFVKYYYDLHEQMGNEIDESGEFEKYKAKIA
ncbi:hypothetical protein DMB92_01020 [Campylobacter sp. MIT 99-7217]|uniref:invasion protein CiaB n=1 Tax=Campylobacter sp. MIT 99-7217 TaxID=535091 RepID=UPI00115803F7|nr:invasion protein CiaB [Campylobacter sp. MIT 99-7217]TQR34576.1 hypothetical protein DMB92_01020 [Campylobacter sp. MIT 99-7217]